ncbi:MULTISPECIES: hypothetical protein [unclassified Staphylococcus]|uniref:hypothetical protein n=1 Tax=unclassified Staphylococcus TaxID=91994 RepID=UPI0021D101D9|nr:MULTISPECIES: hypothetical protein [unclassified Staphylococcus]UXR78469.1 hypothetical protein MUA92_00725 [Staphylococcus sp. IVB6227]UXR82627.1 hypothetical protein MUA51_00695 [Staphylococcus sp. IVB6214]
MKKVLGIFTTTVLAIALVACSNGNHEQDNQEKDKSNKKETVQNKSNEQTKKEENQSSNQSSEKQISADEAVEKLTDEEKVALALYELSLGEVGIIQGEVSISKDELMSGQYTQKRYGPPGTSDRVLPVSQLILTPETVATIPGAPSDLKLYKPYPQKSSGSTGYVAISNDQIMIYATQHAPRYQDLLDQTSSDAANVYNIKDLYNKHSDQDYKELASKIAFGPEPPQAKRQFSDEPTQSSTTSDSEESSSNTDTSSSSDTTVTRENVIDIVEEYEGHALDTEKYTYREPEQMDDGNWGFSFLNKAGNLAGSYIVSKDGTVTKYDEKGIEE